MIMSRETRAAANKVWFTVFFLLLLLLPDFVQSEEQGLDATVLIYHRFGDDRYPSTNVSAEAFEAQMAFLEKEGYRVIPLKQLVRALEKGENLPDRSVVITIDDAYRSIIDVAWPILRTYSYPFTVFVYTGAVDKGYSDFLNWQQIRKMAAAGVDFQDHGFTHHHMADIPEDMGPVAYEKWLAQEMATSRNLLSRSLGQEPDFFAVPYGEYNETVLAVARRLGYQAVLSQNPGSVSSFCDTYAIPREPILGKEWASIDHFDKVLARVDLPLVDRNPLTRTGPVGIVGARLLHPDRYVDGTLGIYVSGLGWQQARRDGDFFSAEFSGEFSRKNTRVTFSGREKGSGRQAVRSWLLY